MANQGAQPAYPQEFSTLFMFGDSITNRAWEEGGSGAALQALYARKWDVLNRGFGGYNTAWALHLLPKVLPPHKDRIKLATIWFGANDATLPIRPQSVPLDDFKSNLKKLVELFPASTPILLITPPPFGPGMRLVDVKKRFPDQDLELDREIERTRSFARAVEQVAAELSQTTKKGSIASVEVHDSMETAAIQAGQGDREKGLERYLSDGLHLAPEGYKVSDTSPLAAQLIASQQLVTDKILQAIATHFPDLEASQVDRLFPPHDIIDPKHPEKFFA